MGPVGLWPLYSWTTRPTAADPENVQRTVVFVVQAASQNTRSRRVLAPPPVMVAWSAVNATGVPVGF